MAKFSIPAIHPSLPGHFPGNPVVPGVVILNEIIRIIEEENSGLAVIGIRSVKFIEPLRSEVAVTLCANQKNTETMDVVCEKDGKVVVKGQFVLSSKDAT